MIYPIALLILTVGPIGLALWLLRRRPRGRRRAVLFILLPLPWFCELTWALMHHRDLSHPIPPDGSTDLMVSFVLCLTAALGVAAIVILKGTRFTAAGLGLLHTGLAFLIGLLSVMTVTGNWI
jgi:hypothetical protein